MIDEHKEETLSFYVLDLLEGAEKTAFEAELARDPELQKLADELRVTSTRLGLLAPQVSPSPTLRARVLSSAKPRVAVTPATPARTSAAPAKIVRFPLAAILGWAAAACFALFAGALAVKTTHLADQLAAQKTLAAQTQTRLQQEANVASLKVSSLGSLLASAPKAKATIVWNPLTQQGVLTAIDMPALEKDKDYQLWLVDPHYPIPVNGGTFRVDPATGEAHITFKPDLVVSTVSKFAVSLERRGGVPKAEGPMVLLSL